MRRVLKTLTVLFLLIISIFPIALPVHAAIHTYYLGSSTVGSCSGRCDVLTTAPGTGIAIDNQATSTVSTDSAGRVIISFTDGTGTNGLLVVGGTVDNSAITGVTYQNIALTLAVADTQKPFTSIWYLVNPPSGTANVVVTSASSTPAAIGVISFNGVDQTTPIPTTAKNDNANGATSPATVIITNANANSWVMDIVGSGDLHGFTNGASTTTQWNVINSGNSGASSTKGPLSASTVTNFSWTLGNADAWNDVAVEIKPFAGTSQVISTTTGNFMVEPDVSASATGTPTTSTPSGYAWETPSDLGAQVVSGIWTFDLTVGSSASTGTASVWITVWNCQTSSEETCAFLFKNWDNTTNVISTGATKRTYVTGTVGPFDNVKFLVVEYWLHVTVAGASGQMVRETTVSSASDVGTPGFAFSYSLPENPTVSDSQGTFFQGFRAPPGESPTVSDSSTKLFRGFRINSETPPLSDAMVRLFTGFRALAEMPTISDAIARVFTGFRGLTESIAGDVTDSIRKSAGKFVSETPALSDVTSRLFTGFRSLTETPDISDIAERLFAGFRGLTESTTVSDAIARFFAGVRSPAETPAISDAVSRVFTGFRGLTENLAGDVTDSISKSAGKFVSETPALSDVTDRLFTGFRSLTESPTISDIASRAFTGFRGLPENLASAIADSVSKGAGKFAVESVVPSDVVGRVFAGFRTLTESPTVADSVARVFSGARDISENLAPLISDTANRGTFSFLSEAVAPSDVATSVFNGFRTLSETPSVSDAADRVFTGFRTTSEDFGSMIADVLGKGVPVFPSEVVSVSDVVDRVFAGFRTLSETTTVSDVASRVFTGFRTTSENLASMISDVINRGVARSLSEVVSVAASVSKGAGKFPLLSVVPSDVVGRVFTGARAISENSVSSMSDSVTRAFTGFRSTSESLASAIAASVSKGAGKFPLLGVVSSDVVGRVFTGARAISENSVSSMSDSVTRAFTGFRSTSESLASAIAASVSKGAGKFPLLSVVPSDVMGRVFTGFRTLSETPTLSDAASRAFTGFRTTSENLASAISDVVNKGVARSISVVVSIAASVRKDVGKFPLETLVPSDVASRVFTGARAISEHSVSAVSDA